MEYWAGVNLSKVLPEVGLSRKITDGRLIICRATHKRRFCPPLSPAPTDPPTTTLAIDVSPVCKVKMQRVTEKVTRK